MQACGSILEKRLLELCEIAMDLLLSGQPRAGEALAIPDRPGAYQAFDAPQGMQGLDLTEPSIRKE